MDIVANLLILYSGILVINVGLSAVLWSQYRTALHGNLFWVWATAIGAFLAQIPAWNPLVITLGFSATISTTLAMAFLLARLVELKVAWRVHLALLGFAIVASVLAYRYGAPPWIVSLPTCVAVAAPIAITSARALLSRSAQLTTSGWALGLSCLAFSFHNLDFAFLRYRPEYTAFGFTAAILIGFALSITAPAVVLERAVEERARAVELDRFRSQFFASITHELKTPLTMILVPIELMLEGELGPVSEAQRSTLQAMSRSGVKLLQLIGDLLDLSKLEESRLRLRIEEQDLVAYLGGLLEQIRPLAERKSIRLSFEADCSSARVWCDLERIERVFINLLSNALKFTPMGGTIRVELRDEASSVFVGVLDSGPGFPPHLAERLFERFYQVDDDIKRMHGGTGIGLALARELIELHGGSIWADSEPGKGAAFSVRLIKDRAHFGAGVLDRRARATDKLRGQRESDLGLAGWEIGFQERYRFIDIEHATEKRVLPRDTDEEQRAHSVLVVEDTPDVIRVIHLALHQHFRVFNAPDGARGFALAVERRPTLIITDLMMPEMDGLELTRRLRADARTRHTPIVMLTARGGVDDRVAGLETGVNAYLTKPFAPKELLSTVRSLLSTQDSTAELLLSHQTASLESIAGGLAHEIKNPLNYIKNAMERIRADVETLLSGVRSDGGFSELDQAQTLKLANRVSRMCDTAQSGVKRIGNTVDLMLRYSREGYSRVMQPYDVFAAVFDVIGVVAPALGSDAKVRTSLIGDGSIECVPDEINQVITNLIQNAIEAVSPEDGVVEVNGRVEGSELVLSVADNGRGIDADEQSRIFTAFYTTKDVGRGIGMGLTITRRCVTALGGTISVKSQLGIGTEFTVRLPRQQPRRRATSSWPPARTEPSDASERPERREHSESFR